MEESKPESSRRVILIRVLLIDISAIDLPWLPVAVPFSALSSLDRTMTLHLFLADPIFIPLLAFGYPLEQLNDPDHLLGAS